MTYIDRQEITFGEDCRLFDDLSVVEYMELPITKQSGIYRVEKNFTLIDLAAEGQFYAEMYHPQQLLVFPRRTLERRLSLDDMDLLQQGSLSGEYLMELGLNLSIPKENWEMFKAMSNALPVCLVNYPPNNISFAATFNEGKTLSKEYKFIPKLGCITWRLLEEDPEKLVQRWKEFLGDGASFFDGRRLGEFLLVPNREEVLKEISLKFHIFGGKD